MTTNDHTPRNTSTENNLHRGDQLDASAPRKRRRWVAPLVAGVGGLIIGGVAFGGASGGTTAAAPAPTATVTADAEVREVETTPPSCAEALANAEAVIDLLPVMETIAQEYSLMVGDVLAAVSQGDVDAILAEDQQLKAEYEDAVATMEVHYPAFVAASEDCTADRA